MRVQSPRGDFHAHPGATDDLDAVSDADVIFLALKAHSLPDVADRLGAALAPGAAVIAAQNGIPWWYFEPDLRLESVDPGGRIAAAIAVEHVIGCVIYCSTEIVEPGVIRHIEGRRFALGEPDGADSERCVRISEAFRAGGLRAPVETDLREQIWLKLIGNVAFNAASALTGATLGELGSRPEMVASCARCSRSAPRSPKLSASRSRSRWSDGSRRASRWATTRRRCCRTWRPAGGSRSAASAVRWWSSPTASTSPFRPPGRCTRARSCSTNCAIERALQVDSSANDPRCRVSPVDQEPPLRPAVAVDELWRQTATELALRIRRRELSATEVVGAHLARIDAVNPELNAIVTLDREGALAAADEADQVLARGEPTGPLHGLPIAVKDLEDTAGIRTTYGSPIFRDHVPAADTLLVARLRRAGAIVIGKTNTPEFGAGSQTFNAVFGATRNPFDHSRTPGGSSGGAAAAVASGMLPLADGSDFGGSVRNPAAFCGLVGLRPSPGRIPALPTPSPWSPLPVLGPIARTVADAALLLRALCGPDPRAPLSLDDPPEVFADVEPADLGAVRIAWSDDLGGLPVEPEVTAVLRRRRSELEALGCTIADAEPDLREADEAFEILRGCRVCARVR